MMGRKAAKSAENSIELVLPSRNVNDFFFFYQVGMEVGMDRRKKKSRSVYSICAYLTTSLFVTCAGGVKLRIIAPQHGTIMNIADLRANNGLDVDISVSVRTHEEYATAFYGHVLCLYINGTAHAHIGVVSMSSAHSIVVPSTLWQVGQTWIHAGLYLLFCPGGGAVSDRPFYSKKHILGAIIQTTMMRAPVPSMRALLS